ncbi:MAG: hypothetical protein JOZ90_16240 [Alphaproteobacteria bacterium]|nr:hypothetical protein [Alphaproteobacteria bacterium]MBV9371993.1 hypothetical protein [Alphaproteobacteria bacterium]MBV9902622.1 hypothetical protein [Alphaproteobacteria bacterium]
MSWNPAGNGRALTLLGALAAIPLLIALAVVLARGAGSGSETMDSIGYDRVVNELFAPFEALRLSDDPARRVVEIDTRVLESDPLLRKFYEDSFLKGDIQRNDPGLWRISGRVLGVAPGAHRVISPFAPTAWLGNITFGDQRPKLVLTFRQGNARVADLELTDGRIEGEDPMPADRYRNVDIFNPTSGPPAPLLYLYRGTPGAGGSERFAAVVRTLAGHAWLEPVDDDIYIDNAPEPLRRGKGVLLQNGTSIAFGAHGDRRLIMRETIAAMSSRAGVGLRYRDPRYETMARAIEEAMGDAVLKCGAGCDLRTRSIPVTLDPDLDGFVQNVLSNAARSYSKPAAVTVMNALNGDVLSLASYDPDAGRRTAEAAARGPAPINYNFELLAVGSVAKPLVSAAILSRFQDLRRLRLSEANVYRAIGKQTYASRLLGIPLGASSGEMIGAHPVGGGWIDFPTYLQKSSNYYAASLMLLATSPDPMSPDEANRAPTGGSYMFEGAPPPQFLPRFRVSRTADGKLLHLDGEPIWKANFNALFGIDDRTKGPWAGATDTSIWRNLRNYWQSGQALDESALRPFAPLSPQRQNWRWDPAAHFRQDYLPMILGGAGFGWSNVELAESYSRIATGRRINARLIPEGSEEFEPWLDLGEESRQAICDGLSRVAFGGTADRTVEHLNVRSQVEKVAALTPIRFFSKTGTPEIAVLDPRQQRQLDAEDRLIGRRTIAFRTDRRMAVSGAGGVIAPVDPASRARAIRALAAVAGRELPSAPAAVDRMLAFNRAATDAERERLYQMVDGSPISVVRPPPTGTEFAHAYVFVIAAYADAQGNPHRCDDEPVAALTVAINVQELRPLSALPIAARLLDPEGPLVKYLLRLAHQERRG